MGSAVSVAIASKRVHFSFSVSAIGGLDACFLAPRFCSRVCLLYRCSINTCRMTKGRGEGYGVLPNLSRSFGGMSGEQALRWGQARWGAVGEDLALMVRN